MSSYATTGSIRLFRHGSMFIQQSVAMLWSSVTGTRPGVLLPQKEAPAISSSHVESSTDNSKSFRLGKRKRDQSFKSDIPCGRVKTRLKHGDSWIHSRWRVGPSWGECSLSIQQSLGSEEKALDGVSWVAPSDVPVTYLFS